MLHMNNYYVYIVYMLLAKKFSTELIFFKDYDSLPFVRRGNIGFSQENV